MFDIFLDVIAACRRCGLQTAQTSNAIDYEIWDVLGVHRGKIRDIDYFANVQFKIYIVCIKKIN